MSRLPWLVALLVACVGPSEPKPDPTEPSTPHTTETTPPCDRPEDADGDGVADPCDRCPGFDDAADTDGDGVADACDACPDDAPDDRDFDGVCDAWDACPDHDDLVDADADGVADGCDVCEGVDDATLPPPLPCQDLDEPSCLATTDCWALYATPGPDPWTAPAAYAGCATTDGTPPTCGDALTSARPLCEPEACWLFTSTCVPDGWVAASCPADTP